ncbi:MAG: 50S ribosomal protein L25, partial [Thermoanaerobaculia bacterium]|nr:50S ribosomal protein L25 [Thermoanaerobaculia bacterium]
MSQLTIEVQTREKRNKNANRRLRVADQIPAVVYGGDREPVSIQVGRRTVEDLLKSGSGENAVFLLKLAGTDKSRHAIIRDLQTDPITGKMIHVDFQRIEMSEPIRVTVPVELHGLPVGVKTDGGILDFITRELEVSCLPDKIPPHLDVDVEALHVGQHLEARDLVLPEGVRLVDEPSRVIASVAHGKVHDVAAHEGSELLEASAPPSPSPTTARRPSTSSPRAPASPPSTSSSWTSRCPSWTATRPPRRSAPSSA